MLQRSLQLRGALASLRSCAAALQDGCPGAAALTSSEAACTGRMQQRAGDAPLLQRPSAAPARHISAAAVLAAEQGKGGAPAGKKKSGGTGGAPPPPPTPAAADAGAVDEGLEEEDAAADAMADAFERLIAAAFEMVQQGKPMEAEYVLSEGAR